MVPLKLIFIQYNMEPLRFLVLFLTHRARGMRRRWRRTWARWSSPLPPFALLLLFSSSTWWTRLGTRKYMTSFPCLSFRVRFALFFSFVHFWDKRLLFFNLRLVRVAKVEGEGWGSGLHFYIAMTLGEYSIWSKQTLWNKIESSLVVFHSTTNIY